MIYGLKWNARSKMSKELLAYKLTYDADFGAVYIYAPHDDPNKKVRKTKKVPGYPNVYLDINSDDKILGIEILNPQDITVYDALQLLKAEK